MGCKGLGVLGLSVPPHLDFPSLALSIFLVDDLGTFEAMIWGNYRARLICPSSQQFCLSWPDVCVLKTAALSLWSGLYFSKLFVSDKSVSLFLLTPLWPERGWLSLLHCMLISATGRWLLSLWNSQARNSTVCSADAH